MKGPYSRGTLVTTLNGLIVTHAILRVILCSYAISPLHVHTLFPGYFADREQPLITN